MNEDLIQITQACTHNLKHINLELKKYSFIVITGVSGSGKSSLAFETIHKSGKKHYLQTLLSSNKYLRELLKEPKVKNIENLGPTIALKQEQVKSSHLSTLATQTQIYPLISALWANLATAYCPISHKMMQKSSFSTVFNTITKKYSQKTIELASPIEINGEVSIKNLFLELKAQGFLRVRINRQIYRLEDNIKIKETSFNRIEILIDRLHVEKKNFERLKSSVQSALEISKGIILVLFEDKQELFSDALFSKESKQYYKALTPHDFSFQSPNSACKTCSGLGRTYTFDLNKIIDPDKSLEQEFCSIAPSFHTIKWSNIFRNLAKIHNFKTTTPYSELSKENQEMLLYGSKEKWHHMQFIHPDKGIEWSEYVCYKGIIPMAKKRLSEASSKSYKEKMHALMHEEVCKDCQGSRLKPFASSAKLFDLTIHDFCNLEINDAYKFINKTEFQNNEQLTHLIKRINQTLTLLTDLGLEYLTLNRDFNTLSTGEAQRSRLINQIASTFSNTTYILDEPSIGLHAQDNQQLINALKKLQKNSNTLIIVEHDEQVILSADYLIELGPYGGHNGGDIIFNGTRSELLKSNTLTAKYITKKETIAQKTENIKPQHFIHLKNCNKYNLKGFSVKIPLLCMCTVSGVCGSGKSTLIFNELIDKLARKETQVDRDIEKIYCIDQSSVTKSPRSKLCTYIKVFDDIRSFFSSLKMSQIANLSKSHFSFNTKDASCPLCKGLGTIQSSNTLVDFVTCSLCKGTQFEKSVLEITYKDKNIAQVLEMTVQQAYQHFINIAPIAHKLKLLIDVGLDYLTLKQQSSTLSGGEAQRLKLSRSLVKKNRGHCLYLFDEPTTGLHFHDIQKLIKVLKNLVNEGHSVVIIEHHLDLIRSSDYLIELGPKGGKNGGELLYAASPKNLPNTTPTGKFLNKPPQKRAKEHKTFSTQTKQIECFKVQERRQKPIDINIAYNKISLLVGSKNALKTTFAKETLFYSAYEQYYQTLTPFEKSLLKPLKPAKVDIINNLLPTVYCEKQETNNNPRSTLGTYSGIYDSIRTLWSHMATHYCPISHEKLVSVSEEFILDTLINNYSEKKCRILCPLETKKGFNLKEKLKYFESIGFTRIKKGDQIYPINDLYDLDETIDHDLELLIDSLIIKKKASQRLLDSIKQATKHANKRVRILVENEVKDYYLAFCAPQSMNSYKPLTEKNFSFNEESGMCEKCKGLGSIYEINVRDDEALLEYSSQELITLFLKHNLTKRALKLITVSFKTANCPLNKPLNSLTKTQLDFALDGASQSKKINHDPQIEFLGMHTIIKNSIDSNIEIHELFSHLLNARTCPSCKGDRLNPLALCSKINNKNIAQVTKLSLDKLYQFFNQLKVNKSLEALKHKILYDIKIALDLKLNSLSLSRQLNTLSSSEIQKFNLARILSAKLTNTLFIFDNPTHSLSHEDIIVLKQKLIEVQKANNTILLVSHNQELNDIIDHRILLEKEQTKIQTNLYKKKENSTETVTITNKKNNKKIQIKLSKLNLMRQGSIYHKTSFVKQVLKPSLDQYILHKKITTPYIFKGHSKIGACLYLDSKHIRQTSRSDVATFLSIAAKLRLFFSNLPSAKIKGLSAAHFSYNHRLGMCKNCRGLGVETLYVNNFEESTKVCSECGGSKLNKISSSITYKGLNFYSILSKPVQELEKILIHERSIQNSCKLLKAFNLCNIKLSQKLQTLSSSESNLIYLIDLLRRKKSNSLIVLDNITTSFDNKTLNCFLQNIQKLTSQGHTILLIDQNPLFMQIKDNLIDTKFFLGNNDTI